LSAIVTVALPVFALILAGAIAARRGFLGPHATSSLNLFVVYLALPSVLFQAMARIHPADLGNPRFLAAYGGAILLPFAVTIAVLRASRRRLGDATILSLGGTFSNTGYMGIPLCLIAFGEDSLVPGVVAMMITACPHFAAAIALIEADRQAAPSLRRTVAKVGRALARNPLLVSSVLGLLVALSGFALPVPVDRFLTLMGGASSPCALVAIGLLLGEQSERFAPRLVLRLVAVKLLIQPAIAWVIAYKLVSLPPVWAATAVLMSALPTGSGAFTLAQLYGRERASISGIILVSTVASFVTLSVLLAWLASD
jgi:malonate transporter